MLDIEPRSAAAMNANKDIYFQRENWNYRYFIVWTDDDNCWVFFIVTSVLKSSLKYLNLLQHFIIIMLQ